MNSIKNILTIMTVANVFFLAGETHCSGETEAKNKKPLWEVGLYNSAMTFPHYLGSDEQMYYFLPLPYFIYRGEKVRVDQDSVDGIFLKSEHVESSISLSGFPPVLGDTEAREGMPDLGALFGIGPELKFYFNNRKAANPVYLSAAIQGVSSMDTDFSTAYEGFRCSAKLIYQNTTSIKKEGSSFGFNAGVYYGDSGLHAYYYDVDPVYVRFDRPQYKSTKGHSGHNVSGYLIYGLSDILSLGFFGRWDNVKHAVFNDSPLVRQNDTYMGGISLIWKIYQSEKLVEVDPSTNHRVQ